MPMPQSYNGQVALGKITVATAGTPVSLAVNCGSFGGAVGGTASNPPVPGAAATQFWLQAAVGNGGNLYLLPRGQTAAGNPTAILAIIGPGGSIPFPYTSNGPGMQPENYVLDSDAASCVAYGYATMQG